MYLVDKNCTSDSEYNFINQVHISNPYFPLTQHATYPLPTLIPTRSLVLVI